MTRRSRPRPTDRRRPPSPGEQLPSRSSLARHYGVHEHKVRLAMPLLRKHELIEGEQRTRLRVAHPPVMRALIAPDRDWPYQTELIASGTWRAGKQLTEQLHIQVDTAPPT
ncbi:GntR family transcriptional regulator [Streptomyces inhibens]|nr:GntR family transcriptional regulator [Streptomyces inhibens]